MKKRKRLVESFCQMAFVTYSSDFSCVRPNYAISNVNWRYATWPHVEFRQVGGVVSDDVMVDLGSVGASSATVGSFTNQSVLFFKKEEK